MHPELHPFYQQLRLSSRKSPKRRSLCQVEWEAWAGWEAWAEWEGWCDDWHLKEKSDWLRCDSVIMKDINMVYDEQFILTRHRKQNKLGLQLVLWNMWRLYLVDWCDCMTVEAGSLHSRHLFHFHYRWSLFCKSAFEMMELFDIFINLILPPITFASTNAMCTPYFGHFFPLPHTMLLQVNLFILPCEALQMLCFTTVSVFARMS